jgi:hypothetical protein
MSPNGTNGGHGRRDADQVIVAALAAGASYREAAETGRVSLSTVKRRMVDPQFRVKVAEARDELVSTLRGRVLNAAPAALATLEELATGAESESVRLRAAAEVLDLAIDRRRRFDRIEPEEFRRMMDKVLGAVSRQLTEAQFYSFLRDVQAIADSH